MKTRSRKMLHSLAAVALLGAAACSPLKRGPSEPAATVTFRNEALYQADVFAVSESGGATRLGSVMPGQSEPLTVEAVLLSGSHSVSIMARVRVSGTSPSTGPVTLDPGGRLEVTLTSDARTLTALPGHAP